MAVLPLDEDIVTMAADLGRRALLFSIVGDLFESLLKRRQNLKDSGSLLSGQGAFWIELIV